MRRYRFHAFALTLASASIASSALAPPAGASHRQIAIIQDGVQLADNPEATLQTFRKLGAGYVRVIVPWAYVAPRATSKRKPSFDATNPAAYPAANWTRWDSIDRLAKKYGLVLDFTVSAGAPLWAEGRDIPRHIVGNLNRAWKPSSKDFGQFMQAIAKRYGGGYPDPQNAGSTLPRVGFWSIWNEPNFGEDLGPEATKGSTIDVAPMYYRRLVAAAWNALHRTGHARDTVLIGGLSARGMRSKATKSNPAGHPGDFAQMKPLEFIRHLYCLDNHLHPLRGSVAKAEGCPRTASGSRRFRSQNPGLFKASGFAEHPYPGNLPPNKDASRDPDYATFPHLPREWRLLDRVNRIYGSRTHYSIYNDEYGYITNPPTHGNFVSPTTAAYYMNWAEYLSWKTARIASYMQYPLVDQPPKPAGQPGGFNSGLETAKGTKKPEFNAYRLPLYLPSTKARHGRSLEVWGCARPAHSEHAVTGQPQAVQIQFQRGSRGSFTTLRTLTVSDSRGYFDLRVTLPESGTVRVAYTYPATDPFLPTTALGVTVYSRYQKVSIS